LSIEFVLRVIVRDGAHLIDTARRGAHLRSAEILWLRCLLAFH
jgi:hypothetical protein